MSYPLSSSPPRAPPIKYNAPLGTRWEKEKAAAGGAQAFDLPSDPKNIGPWIIGECVGKGASGRVKIAKHKVTGQFAAVKILPLAPLVNSRASLATQQAKTEKQRLGIDREITMMKLMNHPNILRIYDVYEGKKELFLVLEYVEGGELFDFLVNRGRLHSHEALTFFRQIVYGLNYAHTFSIIHRDLKPENILIASLSPPVIKIADWGMAAFAPPSLQLETSCGSPHYASPEIVNGERYQGNATDIWSCGVILFALLTGRLPFDDKNVKNLLNKVKSGKFDMPQWLDPLAQDLLSRMLVVDVSRRITIPEILSHPWMVISTAATRCVVMDNPSLPPSPSTLARPIPDPAMIDQELFSSLRIIWGRHADPRGDNIREDLCSPAGRGVHAKAFYFLLVKYREETSKMNEVEEVNVSLPTTALPSMTFNLGWELDTQIGADLLKKYDACRASIAAPEALAPQVRSQSIIHPIPQTKANPLPMRRAVTTVVRERPASPAGPRNPIDNKPSTRSSMQSQKGYPKSSFAMQGGVRHSGVRRGYTFSHSPANDEPPSPVPMLPFVQRRHSHRASQRVSYQLGPIESVASAIPDPPPSPTRRSSNKCSSPVDVTPSPHLLPALVPVQPQPTPAANATADMIAKFNHLVAADQGHGRTRTHRAGPIDKENKSIGEESGRDVGKDVGNILRGNVESSAVGKSMKERKNRPPPLEFPILTRKRSALSVLNSPGAPTSPSNSGHNNRLLTSPVVGEFKGWFSNLFNWKQGQAHNTAWILYSSDDVDKTLLEVGRTLTRLGVITEPSGGPTEALLKCRLEEPIYGDLAGLKPVRFKVWVSQVPASHQQVASPLTTPNFLAAPPLAHGRSSVFMNKSPHASPLPSPTFNVNSIPFGCVTVIALAQDKGSATTFRAIWRKLKEVYVDSSFGSGGECFSPPMVSTPLTETSLRFAI
ncbi:hypothetical protein CPB85DRAFT_1290094 [Mucidula mucida]|nr:hypothetical protein CPB85DRAFT_1290094 [Mucidula mucida]